MLVNIELSTINLTLNKYFDFAKYFDFLVFVALFYFKFCNFVRSINSFYIRKDCLYKFVNRLIQTISKTISLNYNS